MRSVPATRLLYPSLQRGICGECSDVLTYCQLPQLLCANVIQVSDIHHSLTMFFYCKVRLQITLLVRQGLYFYLICQTYPLLTMSPINMMCYYDEGAATRPPLKSCQFYNFYSFTHILFFHMLPNMICKTPLRYDGFRHLLKPPALTS